MVSAAAFATAYGHAASPDNERATLKRLDRLAHVLDSAFAIAVIGTRVGADALLNLVPGAGVIVAKGLSAWLVWEAYRLGVPRTLIARMTANVAADLAISVVPVAGWVADIFFRANKRNVALLRAHLQARHPVNPVRTGGTRAPVTIEGEIVSRGGRS